ncbi:MAG: nicotinate (nicotinamide) nucleotide adenylyltransferase [Clostridiales bacterium]|nr:nicotinate (nicotinamide) nucleotide adenylyltransferase [Clostridiales bacterium]
MRIGLFGGSFDPVHNEHIALVRHALQSLRLDKLFVIPAYAPPHKRGKSLSPDSVRLEMCKRAFAPFDKVEVSDYEISQKGTSYSYLTCRHFKEKYENAELFFLVGTDMLRDFPTWKNPQDIVNNVTLAVCAREEKLGWAEKENGWFWEKFGKKFVTIDYNGQAVSSTEIRVLAGAGMPLTPFMPENIAEYITETGLYAVPNAKEALALEKEDRRLHSLRVAKVSAKRAVSLKIDEKKAITSALFHDCAKNLPQNSPLLEKFSLPTEWGEVPESVVHQFQGAYLAERFFGITDREILDAIRYHTSGRTAMGELEKLIFLADMVEEGRSYEGVDELRDLFWKGDDLDGCLVKALEETVAFLQKKGADIYPLTLEAYAYYRKK